MAEDADEIAAQAWSLYLIMNSAVHADDERRCTLERYIKKLYRAGERDYDELVTLGLIYLKRLDLLGDFEFN
jgi:collagenase-like PrtC family protease